MMLLAVFIALLAAGGVYVYIKGVEKKAQQVQVKNVPVVLAKEAIPARTVIEAKMLDVKQLPEPAVTADMIKDPKEIEGKVTTSAIIVGEIIQRPKIAAKGAGMGLSFIVPHGKRALTIKTDDVQGVAGLIKPGDFVDVLSTFDIPKQTSDKSSQSQATESLAVTVLQNAQVLALDQMMEARPPEQDAAKQATSAPQLYALVTLAVLPKEAERVHLLFQKGPLRLTLRPLREFTKTPSNGTTLASIIGKQYFTTKKPLASLTSAQTLPKMSSLPFPTMGASTMPGMPGMSQKVEVKFGPKEEVQVIKGTQVETVGGSGGATVSSNGTSDSQKIKQAIGNMVVDEAMKKSTTNQPPDATLTPSQPK